MGYKKQKLLCQLSARKELNKKLFFLQQCVNIKCNKIMYVHDFSLDKLDIKCGINLTLNVMKEN